MVRKKKKSKGQNKREQVLLLGLGKGAQKLGYKQAYRRDRHQDD